MDYDQGNPWDKVRQISETNEVLRAEIAQLRQGLQEIATYAGPEWVRARAKRALKSR